MVDNDKVELQEIMEIFNITEESALLLIESHLNFVKVLQALEQPRAAIMLCITTGATIASSSGITPYDFFLAVQDVMGAVSEDGPLESIGDA